VEAFESSLRLAAAAVDRLDCEINGRPAPVLSAVAPLREVVESAVERWQVRASLEDRVVNLDWQAGDPCLPGDEVQLAQVLDNLISNGLDHGSGEVTVVANQAGGVIRLVVANRKPPKSVGSRQRVRDLSAQISGRRRHGHGLRIVRRVASCGGGSFRLRQRDDRCEAVLELPLPGGRR
jgi:signal transduction histidine kinase